MFILQPWLLLFLNEGEEEGKREMRFKKKKTNFYKDIFLI